jgi:hypothetical protein
MGAFARALQAIAFLGIHIGIAVMFIWAIWLVQISLTAVGDPRLFDVMPVRFVFDAIDVGIGLAFFLFGILEVCVIYRESYRPILTTGES